MKTTTRFQQDSNKVQAKKESIIKGGVRTGFTDTVVRNGISPKARPFLEKEPKKGLKKELISESGKK